MAKAPTQADRKAKLVDRANSLIPGTESHRQAQVTSVQSAANGLDATKPVDDFDEDFNTVEKMVAALESTPPTPPVAEQPVAALESTPATVAVTPAVQPAANNNNQLWTVTKVAMGLSACVAFLMIGAGGGYLLYRMANNLPVRQVVTTTSPSTTVTQLAESTTPSMTPNGPMTVQTDPNNPLGVTLVGVGGAPPTTSSAPQQEVTTEAAFVYKTRLPNQVASAGTVKLPGTGSGIPRYFVQGDGSRPIFIPSEHTDEDGFTIPTYVAYGAQEPVQMRHDVAAAQSQSTIPPATNSTPEPVVAPAEPAISLEPTAPPAPVEPVDAPEPEVAPEPTAPTGDAS